MLDWNLLAIRQIPGAFDVRCVRGVIGHSHNRLTLHWTNLETLFRTRTKENTQLVSASVCRRRLKYGRDDRFTGVQHRDQHGVRVEVALVGSPNDAAERLLRVSAPPGAIAAPHFPRDHRRPDRVFRPPEWVA